MRRLIEMAYRNDLEALLARHAALEAEVAQRTRMRDEVARLLADAREREEAALRQADRVAGGPSRRRRRRALMATAITALALVTGGVGYGLAQPKPDRFAVALEQLSLYADEMCGCSNAACAQQVSDAMSKWAMELAKDPQSRSVIDEATTKRATEIGSRIGICMSRAMNAPVVPTAP